MSTSPESKALKACRALYVAKQEVAIKTAQIGECLLRCREAYEQEHQDPYANGYRSHLETAYAPEKDERGRKVWLDQDEVDDVLAPCPHCMQAHKLIQERKLLRIALGIAKRRVTMIGRNAT